MSFTHLHVSTAFSAHYGVSWPDELAQAAAAQGATALGCTDRDGLYGTVKHLKACMAAGIDPVVGVDLSVFDDEGEHDPGVAGARVSKTRFSASRVTGRVVVLAHGHNNGAGY
jgi:error-prone DNA polymerase